VTSPERRTLDLRWAWVMPALAGGTATLVAITVLNIVLGDDSDAFDRRQIDASTPAATISPTMAASDPSTSGKILLRPDGLDLVDFGQPLDDVIAALTKRLGMPDEDKTPPCQSQVDARSRWVRWADLSAIFSGNEFVGYIEGIHFPPGSPALDLSTAEGLSPGDTVDRLQQLYGHVSIRQETPQPGQIATELFTIFEDSSEKISGVLENQGHKTVVTAIFAGQLC